MIDRRRLLGSLVPWLAMILLDRLPDALIAGTQRSWPEGVELSSGTVSTLEAYADTIVPGAKRSSTDVAVAGAATGPGAVHAGAVDLLTWPPLSLCPILPTVAIALDTHASTHALGHGVRLPWGVPPFVGLPFAHRTDLVSGLTRDGASGRMLWVMLAFACGLAFDAAAHRSTVDAVLDAHPGMVFLGFPEPSPDGSWRFAEHSYRAELADRHPMTTPSGSPW